MPAKRSHRWPAAWALGSAALAGWLAFVLLGAEDKTLLSPGPMTHGHHSIELACGACHGDAFGGAPVLQESCVSCHGEELKRAKDAHPRSKFTDPRNADRTARLDARRCVTCHVEHRPEITRAMAVTLPDDFCVVCHRDIAEDRESHRGLAFATCASAGCHNFHDNRALYEDFLLKHAAQPALLPAGRLPARDFGARWRAQHPRAAARASDRPAPDPSVARDWLETAHARSGVQCADCHAASGQPWSDTLDHTACTGCHEAETTGFLAGKHGMRLPHGLGPMTPALARLPMQREAAHRELGCTSCHAAHRFDTAEAAVDACLGCHADEHSRAYRQSPHAMLWTRERAGSAGPGAGVSCAGCHMPRELADADARPGVSVQHNQNDALRPNEKMIRPVCQHCHGLGFALDALADADLVRRNFSHPPARHVESIDMALRRSEGDRARRARPGVPAATVPSKEHEQ